MIIQFITTEEIVKRLKGLSWHSVVAAAVFFTGFVTNDHVKALIEQYPEQLGFLVGVSLVAAQITKLYTNYLQFKKEISDLENNS